MAVTIRFKLHAACPKHPRYNPARQGKGGIKGGCPTCEKLWRIWGQIEHAEDLRQSLINDLVRVRQVEGGDLHAVSIR